MITLQYLGIVKAPTDINIDQEEVKHPFKLKEKRTERGLGQEDADGEDWHDDKTVAFVKDLLTKRKGRLYDIRRDKGTSAQWDEHDRPVLQQLDKGKTCLFTGLEI